MSGTQGAPWARKSRARDGTAEVIVGVARATGKAWASPSEDGLDSSARSFRSRRRARATSTSPKKATVPAMITHPDAMAPKCGTVPDL